MSEILVSPNGKFLYCVCASLYKISVFDLQKQIETNKFFDEFFVLYFLFFCRIMEKDEIISAQISSDGNFLLLNTSNKNPVFFFNFFSNFLPIFIFLPIF